MEIVKGKKSERQSILRLFRIARDMSVKELAEKMEVSSSYICDIERGIRNPSLETYKKFSKAFRVPLSTLMFFDEEQTEYGYNYRRLLISILQKIDQIDTQKGEKENL